MAEDTRYVKWLIGVEARRLLGDQRLGERRLKASRPVITPSWPTSCWPEILERATRVKRLTGRPQESA